MRQMTAEEYYDELRHDEEVGVSYDRWEHMDGPSGLPGFNMYRLKLRAGWLFLATAPTGAPAMTFVPEPGQSVGTEEQGTTFGKEVW